MHYIDLPVSQGKIMDWQTFHHLLMQCGSRVLIRVVPLRSRVVPAKFLLLKKNIVRRVVGLAPSLHELSRVYNTF